MKIIISNVDPENVAKVLEGIRRIAGFGNWYDFVEVTVEEEGEG